MNFILSICEDKLRKHFVDEYFLKLNGREFSIAIDVFYNANLALAYYLKAFAMLRLFK